MFIAPKALILLIEGICDRPVICDRWVSFFLTKVVSDVCHLAKRRDVGEQAEFF